MPVYEYECGACGHQFEEWQKITDQPVKVCPKCKKKKVERLISQTSFQLKGGGWYSDLYASKGGGSKKGDGGGDGGDTTTKDSGSKETAAKDSTTKTPAPPKKKDGGGGKKAASAV